MVVVAVVTMECVGDGGFGCWMIVVVFLTLERGENLLDGDGDDCLR